MKRTHDCMIRDDNETTHQQGNKRIKRFMLDEDTKRAIQRTKLHQPFVTQEDRQWFHQPNLSILAHREAILQESYYYMDLAFSPGKNRASSSALEEVCDNHLRDLDKLLQQEQAQPGSVRSIMKQYEDLLVDDVFERDYWPVKMEKTTIGRIEKLQTFVKNLKQQVTMVEYCEKEFLSGAHMTTSTSDLIKLEQEYNALYGADGYTELMKSSHMYEVYDDITEPARKFDGDSDIEEWDLPEEHIRSYIVDDFTHTFPIKYSFEKYQLIPDGLCRDLDTIEADNNDEKEEMECQVFSNYQINVDWKLQKIDWNNLITNSNPYLQLLEYLTSHLPESAKDMEKIDDMEHEHSSDEQYACYLKLLTIILHHMRQLENSILKHHFGLWSRVIIRVVIDQFAQYYNEELAEDEQSDLPSYANDQKDNTSESDSDDDFYTDESDCDSNNNSCSQEVATFWEDRQAIVPQLIPVENDRIVSDNYLYSYDDNGEEEPIFIQNWGFQEVSSSEDEISGEEEEEEEVEEEEEENEENEFDSIHNDIIKIAGKSGVHHLSAQAITEMLFCVRGYIGKIIREIDYSDDNGFTHEDVIDAVTRVNTTQFYQALDDPEYEDDTELQWLGFQLEPSTIDQDLLDCSLDCNTHQKRLQLLDDGTESDITLLYSNENEKVSKKVHKQILKARCPYFEAMFSDESEFSEVRQKEIDMSETFLSANSIHNIIFYLYTDELPQSLDFQQIIDIMSLSDFFTLPRLRDLCENELCIRFDSFKFTDVWEICRLVDLPHLFKRIERIIVYHIYHNVDIESIDLSSLYSLELEFMELHTEEITVYNVIEKLETSLSMITQLNTNMENVSLYHRLDKWKIQYVWYIVRHLDQIRDVLGSDYQKELEQLTCTKTQQDMLTVVHSLYNEYHNLYEGEEDSSDHVNTSDKGDQRISSLIQ